VKFLLLQLLLLQQVLLLCMCVFEMFVSVARIYRGCLVLLRCIVCLRQRLPRRDKGKKGRIWENITSVEIKTHSRI
jgi:hypothetical protein